MQAAIDSATASLVGGLLEAGKGTHDPRQGQRVRRELIRPPTPAPISIAAAPLNVACPETYSGKEGVTSSGVHCGSTTVRRCRPYRPPESR